MKARQTAPHVLSPARAVKQAQIVLRNSSNEAGWIEKEVGNDIVISLSYRAAAKECCLERWYLIRNTRALARFAGIFRD